jgi:hypothetical protein
LGKTGSDYAGEDNNTKEKYKSGTASGMHNIKVIIGRCT